MCEVIERGDGYPEIRVVVPETAFRPVGTSEDQDQTTGQLLSTLVVQVGSHTVHLHLDAIAVQNNGDFQSAADDASYTDEDFGDIHNGVGADGHWDTLEIHGRHYVLIASPFC